MAHVTLESFAQMIQNQFSEFTKRFDQLDSRFDLVNTRFDLVDARFDRVEQRLDRIENLVLIDYRNRLEKIEDKVRMLENSHRS